MMGTYRLILAAVVVLFHFGGLPPLSGRTAVFGFYALSGYLMVMVIDKVYSKMSCGSINFYINRALRIYPLYIIYIGLMLALIFLHGGTGFFVDPNEGTFDIVRSEIPNYSASQYFNELLFGIDLSAITHVNPHCPSIIPQAWSLSIEILFYLTAPFLVLGIRRKWVGPVLLSIFIGYILLTLYLGVSFEYYRYKSFLGSYFVFIIGGLIYRFRDETPNLRGKPILFILGLAIWALLINLFTGEPTDLHFYCIILLMIMLTIIVVQSNTLPKWYKKIDKFLGNLSYGVFLNHFVVAFMLLSIADYLRISTGIIYPLGRINGLLFGLIVCAGSLFFALLTYLVIEKPIETYREKIHTINFFQYILGMREKIRNLFPQ